MEYNVPLGANVVEKMNAPRTDVRKAVLHKGVTMIGTDAFRGWENLEEVVIPVDARLE